MSKGLDLDDAVKSDAEKLQQVGSGNDMPTGGKLLEVVLWGLALASVAGMMIALPWVGEGKLLPGTVWLGYSLASILLFGTLAGLVRWVRVQGDDVDREMTRRFEPRR